MKSAIRCKECGLPVEIVAGAPPPRCRCHSLALEERIRELERDLDSAHQYQRNIKAALGNPDDLPLLALVQRCKLDRDALKAEVDIWKSRVEEAYDAAENAECGLRRVMRKLGLSRKEAESHALPRGEVDEGLREEDREHRGSA
jgi:hypothetical protein